MIEDERGISQIVVIALMIGIAVAAAASIAAFTGGLLSFHKTPNVQLTAYDDPTPVSQATRVRGAFIIRDLGGDRVSYNDLVLVVYNSTGQLIYNNVVANAVGKDLTLEELNAPGYTKPGKFFEGGEEILAGNATIGGNNPGTYEVVLYYKPTMQPLLDKKIVVT